MPLSSVSAPTAHTRTPGQTPLVVDRTGAQDAAVVRAAPTLRYVRKTGLDSNGGTSPIDAWLTIGKALTTVASNTLVYVGAGVYREVVTVTITPTQEVAILGDVDGSKTGDAGIVQWTAYTTNDKTAPSATALLNLNGKSNLTFSGIFFMGGAAAMILASTQTSQNITFRDCSLFTQNQRITTVTCAANTPLNWTFDRCYLSTTGIGAASIFITLSRSVTADYDANFTVKNCVFLASALPVEVLSGGAGTLKGGGVRIYNTTAFSISSSQFLWVADANISSTIPCVVMNCFLVSASAGSILQANMVGQIVEDYNILVAASARTNVTIGPHTIADGSYSPLYHFGQELQAGMFGRPFGEPMSGSPLLNFGNDGNQSTTDGLNRPRPTGSTTALPAVGALERSNVFVKQTGTVHTGANAISATGPAYQDFLIPVDTTATTVSVFAQYNATYTGPRPKLQLLPNPEIGVTALEAVMVGPSGAWEQLTLAPFTATANGIVTVRVLSSDLNGGGTAYFDSFAVV